MSLPALHHSDVSALMTLWGWKGGMDLEMMSLMTNQKTLGLVRSGQPLS